MKTIVYSNLKGGVGKTTHSAHFACALEDLGHGPVVTMDLDPQGSLSAWWNDRTAATPAFALIENVDELEAKHAALVEAGYTWCVIDTPPSNAVINEAAMKLADLIIIPIKHSPHDIRAAGTTVDLCGRLGKKFFFLLNETNGKAVALDATRNLAAMGPVIPHHIPKLNGYWMSMIPGGVFKEFNKGTGAIVVDQITDFVVSQFVAKPKKEKAHV